MTIQTEALAGPGISVAVYSDSIPAGGNPSRTEVMEESAGPSSTPAGILCPRETLRHCPPVRDNSGFGVCSMIKTWTRRYLKFGSTFWCADAVVLFDWLMNVDLKGLSIKPPSGQRSRHLPTY